MWRRPVQGSGYPSKPEGPPEKWEGLDKYIKPDVRILDKKKTILKIGYVWFLLLINFLCIYLYIIVWIATDYVLINFFIYLYNIYLLLITIDYNGLNFIC